LGRYSIEGDNFNGGAAGLVVLSSPDSTTTFFTVSFFATGLATGAFSFFAGLTGALTTFFTGLALEATFFAGAFTTFLGLAGAFAVAFLAGFAAFFFTDFAI
jgi:hypothetical protein